MEGIYQMSLISAKILNKSNPYKNIYFSLKVVHRERELKIKMDMLTPIFDTRAIPQTYEILKKELPSIMHSKCFNENNFAFAKEVRNTEIGHLFEHILLEYICERKRMMGVKNPIHNGLTSWNWQKEAQGRFHISLDVWKTEEDIVKIAVVKTSDLLTKILMSSSLNGIYKPDTIDEII